MDAGRLHNHLILKIEILATLALGLLYLATMSGHQHSIDGLLMFRQARAIAYEHSIQFATPLWWGTPITESRYGIGLSLLYLPGLFIWSWLLPYTPAYHGNPMDWNLIYNDPLYTAAGAPVHIVITVLAAYLVARFCRTLGLSRTTALWGFVLYGVASPAIVYARGDFSQPLEGLCWIAALYAAVLYTRTKKLPTLSICGLALGYAILTRLAEGFLLVPAALLLLIPHLRFLRWQRPIWFALGTVMLACSIALAITLWLNWARFGSPFITGYEGYSWTNPPLIGLAGTLISPGRGILFAFPASILLPVGVWYLFRTRGWKITTVLTGLIIAQILNMALWVIWWGGTNWGPRLFLPALPITAVVAAGGIDVLRGLQRRVLPAILLVAGILWAIPCVVTDLFGGYSVKYDNMDSFRWDAYPFIGAWGSLNHLFARAPIDMNTIDILWTRAAIGSGYTSLIPPVLFLLIAAVLLRQAYHLHKAIRISDVCISHDYSRSTIEGINRCVQAEDLFDAEIPVSVRSYPHHRAGK